MKKRFDKRKTIYVLVSFLLFAGLFLLTFPRGETAEKQAVELVFFGDSVYGNIRDESGIANQVAEYLEKTVYNAAIGGTSASRQGQTERLDYSGSSLSLAALVKAVYAEDFGVQQTIRLKEDVTRYVEETIDGLEKIDFGSVETVIVGHGLNDYHLGAPLDNEKNPMDEATFAGALRKSVATLKKINPKLRIVLVTPTYSWYVDKRMTCEEYNPGGGILEEYVEKLLDVAKECGLEVIDLYHDFYPTERWEDWELFTFDGFHPNEAGRTMIAEKITEYLEGEVK